MQNFNNASFATALDMSAANRRTFLKGVMTSTAALALQPVIMRGARAAEAPDNAFASASAPMQLDVVRRIIEVNGRAAHAYGIQQPGGSPGIRLREGDAFNVILRNTTPEPTSVHWHGLLPPWASDGVPGAPLPPIAADTYRGFNFPVGSAGTYWMHAHTLQEQQLLAAPLIVAEKDADKRDEQEVVILLHDFSFKSPQELLLQLRRDQRSPATKPEAHAGNSMDGSMSMTGAAALDLNDIDYDAYLANDRTLDDPEIVPVERGSRVRVRVINGATATAFMIDFGALTGMLVAVDGQPVQPVEGQHFPLSMAQRIDVLLQLPRESGAFPVLALREGSKKRTGIVLRTNGSYVPKLSAIGQMNGPVLDLGLESRLRALNPLAVRVANKAFDMALTGDMTAYRWGIETRPRLAVDRGDRVEVTLRNTTMMAHPMHLHGHHFQVVAIDGRWFAGPVRDTVLVPPRRSVTIAVDADNPGQWAFHCHHLYHMATGMIATFAYNP
ncbi:multicopper oxidase family protein (plasmid) [Burkholderia thailandensis]|uniref:multicopper oxidase family protein n=1 Tax=Burkholderia thailandensis TaxID=57975 RepID=UPI00192E19A6|nr:multicopper oxidase family protein [Burkholderia thailandensis]MBS2132158.1 multicopper oxidase family protein [Burkholderia thailandensis]QRA15261.1 multicopper oxidase family protein [Burkholderia thailandensis]